MHIRRISQTKIALGGDITLAIITEMSDMDVDILFRELWRRVYLFERKFSRFLPKSELSIFNQTTGVKRKISAEFKQILTIALNQGVKNDGLYNPFILPALQRAGYTMSAMTGYENDKQISYIERRIVETNRLMIGEDWALIPYGSAIDLGGCGKGYLADQIGQILDSYPIVGYWLSMGGDIVTKGVDENGNNIILNIQDANNLGGVSEWIVNCPKEYFSVATSGTFKRKHQNIPEGWHHIINPKTQMPAVTDIRLATICADKSVDSDVLASCAIILGSKKAPAFLKKHGAKSALLQCMTSEGLVFEKVFGEQINKIKVSQKV